MNYIPTIGLEIHSELKTLTKMFCKSLNVPLEETPNVNVCPICMGHPGTLPVPNKDAIWKMIRIGTALNCTIAKVSKFDRKNYFYPDLPKGYQISQFDQPLCEQGYLSIGNDRNIRITRIHLEEDAGKLAHPDGADYSLVDYNRAGVPLMELVTEPDIQSGEEARNFAEELQLILRYLGASDADMEKGQMRVEVNISIAPQGSKELGTKVEIKNLNSFRAVERAAAYEIKRQSEVLENGEEIIHETRGWDEAKQRTFSQRAKELAHDYRYFPEPDIPPLRLTEEAGFPIKELSASIPELPQQKRDRFTTEYYIDPSLAEIFIHDRELAKYFEEVISELLSWENAIGHTDEAKNVRQKLITLCTNYVTTDLRKLLDEKDTSIADCNITQENMAELVKLIHEEKITSRVAKDLLPEMFDTGADPGNLVQTKGLDQVNDAGELESIVDKIIEREQDAVEKFKSGNENLLQYLVGQVMKDTKGRAHPQIAAEVLKRKMS
jgi:aspartyl-tRNA(Asn)/glutamyl-tRNA(Gln) amidotransferase subunit B